MAKSPLGLFAGRDLRNKKKQQRWAISTYKRRELGLDKKSNPFAGSPQAKGIVLEKVGVDRLLNVLIVAFIRCVIATKSSASLSSIAINDFIMCIV